MRFRDVVRRLHLWTGILLAPVLVVIGLSGSALVYYREIDAWLNPGLLTQVSPGPPRPLSEIIGAAQAALPEGMPVFLMAPMAPWRVHIVRLRTPNGEAEVAVDGPTAEVVGSRPARDRLLPKIYAFHYTLLAGPTGKAVVGAVGLALIFLALSGAYLWWPRRSSRRRAFRVEARRGSYRLMTDLHRVAGAAASMVLVVVAFSGAAMTFSKTLAVVVSPVMTLPVFPAAARDPVPAGAARIAIDAATAIAGARYPDSHFRYAVLPDGPDKLYRINLRQPGELRRGYGFTNVFINPVSGEVENVIDPKSGLGDAFMGAQFPLHNGEAFGPVGRLLVLLSGVALLLLGGTGLGTWAIRRKLQRRSG